MSNIYSAENLLDQVADDETTNNVKISKIKKPKHFDHPIYMKFLDLWDEILKKKEDNIDVHDDYIKCIDLLYNQMLKVYVNNKGYSYLNNNINNTNLIGTKEEEVEEEEMEKKKNQ